MGHFGERSLVRGKREQSWVGAGESRLGRHHTFHARNKISPYVSQVDLEAFAICGGRDGGWNWCAWISKQEMLVMIFSKQGRLRRCSEGGCISDVCGGEHCIPRCALQRRCQR